MMECAASNVGLCVEYTSCKARGILLHKKNGKRIGVAYLFGNIRKDLLHM